MAEPEPPAGLPEPPLSGDPGLMDGPAEARFLDALAGWAAGRRVAGAAAGRSRQRAMTDAAAGSATLVGVLVDLAERGAEVTLGCAGPLRTERLTGRLAGVGRDFVVLDDRPGRPVIVRLDAVTSVWPAGGGTSYPGRPGGDRPAPLNLSIEAVLADLSGQGATVAVVTASETVEGDLLAVGADVLTLRLGGGVRRTVHLPTGALRWCELR